MLLLLPLLRRHLHLRHLVAVRRHMGPAGQLSAVVARHRGEGEDGRGLGLAGGGGGGRGVVRGQLKKNGEKEIIERN